MSETPATPEAPPRRLGFSVLILAFNDETSLPGCLASLQGCDDIVVLDSGSTDRTIEIARQAGARVFTRAFDSVVQQRNYAQREIPFRHPWVLHLDAIERVPVQLRLECSGVIDGEDVVGYLAAPKIYWNGRWVRRASRFPQRQVRFVRAPEFQFAVDHECAPVAPNRQLGELYTCPERDASLRETAERRQWPRSYAVAAARHHLEIIARAPWSDILAAERKRRQFALDRAHAALPFRPLRTFLHRYVWCGGFLEGRAGFDYCRQLARDEAINAEELSRLHAAPRG